MKNTKDHMDDFEHDRKYKGGIECFWAENSHNKSRIIWHQNGGELNNFNLSKQFWGWLKKKKLSGMRTQSYNESRGKD